MGCYYTLCHNTYAFPLLFYKVYMKRENAGNWNSGLEKKQTLETYSAQLKKPRNFTGHRFRKYKKYLVKEDHQGATRCPRGWGCAPLSGRAPFLVGPPMAPR